jgi:hypothetical protein
MAPSLNGSSIVQGIPFRTPPRGFLLGQAEGLNVGCVAIGRNVYNLERISVALNQYDLAFPGHKSIG